MQVYFLPEEVEVEPVLVQGAPALTAPNAGSAREVPMITIDTTRASDFFITKSLLSAIGFVFDARNSMDIYCVNAARI
jgi:hypothetical protein